MNTEDYFDANHQSHDEDELDDEITDLMEEYGVDCDEAEEMRELMDDEGLTGDEAVEIRDFTSGHGSSRGYRGISWVGLIFIIILAAWAYNHYTSKNIEENYGYKVETTGVTDKPDCTSLEPQNPYSDDSGHSVGYEWGASGKDCGGNSDSFIAGCEEYKNKENAYQYCLNRN